MWKFGLGTFTHEASKNTKDALITARNTQLDLWSLHGKITGTISQGHYYWLKSILKENSVSDIVGFFKYDTVQCFTDDINSLYVLNTRISDWTQISRTTQVFNQTFNENSNSYL